MFEFCSIYAELFCPIFVAFSKVCSHQDKHAQISLTGIKFIQVNIKSGYKNISISWYIVGFSYKNVFC